jgi:hypothetical protein
MPINSFIWLMIQGAATDLGRPPYLLYISSQKLIGKIFLSKTNQMVSKPIL